MNGDVRNGVVHHRPNGLPVKPPTSHAEGSFPETDHELHNGVPHVESRLQAKAMANGVVKSGLSDAAATKLLNGLKDMPPEIEEVAREYFVGLGILIGRSAQNSWNGLSSIVDDLSAKIIQPAPQPNIPGANFPAKSTVPPPNTTKENLDKKDALLNFAKDQKDVFIKLLVLLHWSKDVEGVSKVIDLNRWLRDRISRYGEVANDIARMKRYLAFIQIPNPDLTTAAEVLSGQTVTGFSDLGYVPPKPITNKQALRTLRSLNSILCTRLTLHEDLPVQLQHYRIHDGRVTFNVADEFELDVSVLNESFESQFCLADFRFTFSPAADFPAGQLFDDLAFAANDVLGKTGLLACYEFLHEFTLSYQINVLFKQALELLQGQWSNNLRVEMIHRTLIVQYWTNRAEAKSWIEIGVKSNRKRKLGDSSPPSDLSLGVRWMMAGKEVEDADIEFDLQHLSMDALLRQVVARHTSRMFDAVFDNIAVIPLYEKGELLIDQSASSTDPSLCSIKLELAKKRCLKVALETVTGAIVITPTSGLCNQVEADLNRSRNMVEEVPRRLSYLRVKTAEEDLASQAETAGWTVLRSFIPNVTEKVAWFSHVQRSMFFSCPNWATGHMLAATHSPQGDEWWLLTENSGNKWTSQKLDIRSRHLEPKISQAYLRTLQEYSSGMVVLLQNIRGLTYLSIRCVMESMPPVETTSHLPQITLEFHPAKLSTILKQQKTKTGRDTDTSESDLTKPVKPERQSYICNTATVKYLGQASSAGATVELSGSTENQSVDENMLAYLSEQLKDSAYTIWPGERRFSIKLMTPIGRPLVERLLDHVLYLDTVVGCMKAVQESPYSAIRSLTMDSIMMQYRAAGSLDLGLTIHFATAGQPTRLDLTPEGSNPHELVKRPLTKLLSHLREPLSGAIASLLPLLASTSPLMFLFRDIQTEKWYEKFDQAVELGVPHLLPRIHILARHEAMFGIQLYAPAGFAAPLPSGPHRATGMLVRFEMELTTRRGKTKWLLRPAIEEFESYSQPSYCCKPLKEKIEQALFKTTESNSWQPLDSGAACDLENPKPLVQAALGIVTAWMKEYSDSQISSDAKVEAVEQTQTKTTTSKAATQQAQKPRANNRPSGNKGPQKGPQEVITLD